MIIAVSNGFVNTDNICYIGKDLDPERILVYFTNHPTAERYDGKDAVTIEKVMMQIALADINSLCDTSARLRKEGK
jgi:hypothetical protein